MKPIKRWQEPIYALGGFGPGFMYQIVMTYLLYYYRPAFSRVEMGAIVLAPAGAYAFGMLIARILDGVVDIPIATWTDNLKSRWGRRRPLMILGVHPHRPQLSAAVVSPADWFAPWPGWALGQCCFHCSCQLPLFLLPYPDRGALPGFPLRRL